MALPWCARRSASLDELFRRAIGWQLSFQCKDGGWAAFDKKRDDQWLEDVPFADHNAILDPTCSDLTARTLELLATSISAGIIRGCETLQISDRDARKMTVSWYGRWGRQLQPMARGSSRVCRAIGQDMTQDWICVVAIGWRAVKQRRGLG